QTIQLIAGGRVHQLGRTRQIPRESIRRRTILRRDLPCPPEHNRRPAHQGVPGVGGPDSMRRIQWAGFSGPDSVGRSLGGELGRQEQSAEYERRAAEDYGPGDYTRGRTRDARDDAAAQVSRNDEGTEERGRGCGADQGATDQAAETAAHERTD